MELDVYKRQAINTDDEKINFIYNVADSVDSVSADIHDATELFTDVTMKLVGRAKKEAEMKAKEKAEDELNKVQVTSQHPSQRSRF